MKRIDEWLTPLPPKSKLENQEIEKNQPIMNLNEENNLLEDDFEDNEKFSLTEIWHEWREERKEKKAAKKAAREEAKNAKKQGKIKKRLKKIGKALFTPVKWIGKHVAKFLKPFPIEEEDIEEQEIDVQPPIDEEEFQRKREEEQRKLAESVRQMQLSNQAIPPAEQPSKTKNLDTQIQELNDSIERLHKKNAELLGLYKSLQEQIKGASVQRRQKNINEAITFEERYINNSQVKEQVENLVPQGKISAEVLDKMFQVNNKLTADQYAIEAEKQNRLWNSLEAEEYFQSHSQSAQMVWDNEEQEFVILPELAGKKR